MTNSNLQMQDGQLLPEPGALREWQRQLRAGKRTTLTFDPLWRAAVAEANARDYLRYNVVTAANSFRREAAEILTAASEAEAA